MPDVLWEIAQINDVNIMREMIKYTLVMIDSSNNPDFRKMANRH